VTGYGRFARRRNTQISLSCDFAEHLVRDHFFEPSIVPHKQINNHRHLFGVDLLIGVLLRDLRDFVRIQAAAAYLPVIVIEIEIPADPRQLVTKKIIQSIDRKSVRTGQRAIIENGRVLVLFDQLDQAPIIGIVELL